jgi:hypothetical protein
MYDPFVRACNYALDKLSKIHIEGLPEFSEEKQIVFFRNHDRSVQSHSHQRESRVRPDIVLLGWNRFKELYKEPRATPPSYSDSHSTDLCTLNSELKLSWRDVRSTVEMKKFRRRRERKTTFDKDFGALTESAPYTSLVDIDTRPKFIEVEAPVNNCE